MEQHGHAKSSSPSIRYPPIRLSRSASARTMAIIESNRAKALREMQGITSVSTPAAGGDINQLMPGAHALDLVRRIYDEVGEEFEPVGKGDGDKLNSLKIEPAFSLLKVMTWREFYEGKTIQQKMKENKEEAAEEERRRKERMEEIRALRLAQHERFNQMYGSPASKLRDEPPTPASQSSPMYSGSPTPSSSMKKRVDDIRSLRGGGGVEPPTLSFLDALDAGLGTQQQPVDALFLSLVKRIEGVWAELRMPKTDKAFYRKSLLRLGPSGASDKQVQEMGRYLNQLQTHRLATIKALKSVAAREEAVAALRETLSRVEAAEQAGQLRGGGAAQYARVDLLGSSSSHNVLSELAQAVRRVQAASLDVIRRVQKWRKNLWRPHTFTVVLQGMGEVDYFAKMNRDVRNLLTGEGEGEGDGETGRGQVSRGLGLQYLGEIPLCPHDLACVLFSQEVLDAAARAPSQERERDKNSSGSAAPPAFFSSTRLSRATCRASRRLAGVATSASDTLLKGTGSGKPPRSAASESNQPRSNCALSTRVSASRSRARVELPCSRHFASVVANSPPSARSVPALKARHAASTRVDVKPW